MVHSIHAGKAPIYIIFKKANQSLKQIMDKLTGVLVDSLMEDGDFDC